MLSLKDKLITDGFIVGKPNSDGFMFCYVELVVLFCILYIFELI